ncbi:MAG: DNA-binding protein WhiA, partial [Anaerovoracaceae bacterium]
MSFASETKNELARIEPEKKCCQLAEISGFLRVAGSLRLAGGGKFRIVITTENPAIARHYKKLIQEYFGIETRLEIGESAAVGKSRNSRHYAYSITI